MADSKTPAMFTTIDPGLAASGFAMWCNGGLFSVGLIRVPTGIKDLQTRVQMQALMLRSALLSRGFDDHPVVCERMFHRHYRGNRVDPNDLINLNLLSGRLGTHYVLPSTWKGNVPRDVEQSQSATALFPDEEDMVMLVKPASLRKEAWSAVGIGLSILRRAHQKCGWVG